MNEQSPLSVQAQQARTELNHWQDMSHILREIKKTLKNNPAEDGKKAVLKMIEQVAPSVADQETVWLGHEDRILRQIEAESSDWMDPVQIGGEKKDWLG